MLPLKGQSSPLTKTYHLLIFRISEYAPRKKDRLPIRQTVLFCARSQKNTPRACSLTSAEVVNGMRVVYPRRAATIIFVGQA